MASFHLLLIVSSLLPLVLSYPFIPPTCYSKVLSMARELSQWAAELKRGYETVSQLLVCTLLSVLSYIYIFCLYAVMRTILKTRVILFFYFLSIHNYATIQQFS